MSKERRRRAARPCGEDEHEHGQRPPHQLCVIFIPPGGLAGAQGRNVLIAQHRCRHKGARTLRCRGRIRSTHDDSNRRQKGASKSPSLCLLLKNAVFRLAFNWNGFKTSICASAPQRN